MVAFFVGSLAQAAPHIIGDDFGGSVSDRAAKVSQMRLSGAEVVINGQVCMSACTMYLGAGDVCVSDHTVFVFHGPYSNPPLTKEDFDFWSSVMASYYPNELANWFMKEGRHRTYKLNASDLASKGVRLCSSKS